MTGMARLLAAIVGVVVGLGAATLPPTVLPPGLSDIGAQTGQPFVIVCAGQSNATGSDHSGPKTVGANIFITDSFLTPTALVPAAFGTAPLNATTSGFSTDPALVMNNICVQDANALRASGVLPAARPIVIVGDAKGGNDRVPDAYRDIIRDYFEQK